jgi:anti-sigma-K factor RskA
MTNDLHELSALYALDALSEDDRARFEAHLAECEDCRRELASLKDTSAALAFAVEGPAPPSALRGRIVAAARAEPQNVVPLRRRSISTSVAAAIAVAATAAAVGFGIWAATLHHSLAHERTAVSVLGDPSSRRVPLSGANGELVVAPSGDAVLAVRLPALPKGKTYEAWIADGSVRRAGQFAGGTFALTHRVGNGARVMVTVEKSGGVDAPTSQPIITARA